MKQKKGEKISLHVLKYNTENINIIFTLFNIKCFILMWDFIQLLYKPINQV